MLPTGDAEAELKFLVNGKEELTATEFDEKYGEEGYEVAYKYNFTGTLVSKNVGTYKYAVEVTDAEGNKLPEGGVVAADFVDFKLVDATKAVKVNELGLFVDEEAFEHDTVLTSDEVKIAAAVYENALGQKNTDKDEDGNTVVNINEPIIKEIKSSDPLTAYYDGEKIVARKDGEVTFTVEFVDKDLEILQTTIKVTTRAKQTLTSIEAEDLRVKAETDVEFDLKQLDQDGNEMRQDVEVYYTATKAGETEAKTANKLTGTLKFDKGNYTVKLYTAADKKTELGSFAVEAVSVEDGNIDYNLEVEKVDNKTPELILNVDEGKATKSINLLVKTSIDGVVVDEYPVEGVVYEVASSDEDILTVEKTNDHKIKVTAVKEGTATVTLKTVEGDLKQEVASIELEVKNTTEKIDSLTLKADTKVVIGTEDNEDDYKQAVVAAVKEKIAVNQIAKVELVEAQDLVIVTITDDFGGKEFTLDAKYVDGTVVRTEEELEEALTDGADTVYVSAGTYTFPTSSISEGDVIVCDENTVFEGLSKLNIKGATVVGATFKNPTGTAVDQTINGTFKNCTFTGANGLRWCYAGETVVFENCVFDGSTYGVHFDGGANYVTFKNCTISGFNAMAAAITKTTFDGCTFVSNGKSNYNGINMWGDTDMINCTFVFDGSCDYEWIDLCSADKTAAFTNCVVNDGTNVSNVSTLIGNKLTKRETSGKIIVDGTELSY